MKQPTWLDEKGRVNEVAFCHEFLRMRPLRCIRGRFFTVDGLVEDEDILRRDILLRISPHVTTNLAKRTTQLLDALRLVAPDNPLPVQQDRLHLANGTLYLDETAPCGFRHTPEKQFCLNRMPVSWNPAAPRAEKWLTFLGDLLEDEDIPALQEFFGYALLPVTKAQKMLIIMGKGGEGKSRIGLVLRALLGDSMNGGSLQKIETNRFARADLEYKLLLVDDDLQMEALTSTHHLKNLVTLEDRVDIERKGQQSTQGTLYARFICFGNGTLHALYDRSDGFYRRQLLMTVKERPAGRMDDPFLIEKLRAEKEGILLWALEGLRRLIFNHYRFSISERMQQNLRDAMEDGNNLVDFMTSIGYIRLESGTKATSRDLYNTYCLWCRDNLEKPLSQKTFTQFLRQNEKTYAITYSKHVLGDQRGFEGIFIQRSASDVQLKF